MEALSNPFVIVGGVVIVLIIVMIVMFMVEKKRKKEVAQLDNMFPEGNLTGEQLEKIPLEKVRRSTLERTKRSHKISQNLGDRVRPGSDQAFEGDDQEFIQHSNTRSFQTLKDRSRSNTSPTNTTRKFTTASEANNENPQKSTRFSTKKESTHSKSQPRVRTKKEVPNMNPNMTDDKHKIGENEDAESSLNRFRDRLKPSKVAKKEAKEAIEASKKVSMEDVSPTSGSKARRQFKKDILSSEEQETMESKPKPRFRGKEMFNRFDKDAESGANTTASSTNTEEPSNNTISRAKRFNSTRQQQQNYTSNTERRSSVKRKKLF